MRNWFQTSNGLNLNITQTTANRQLAQHYRTIETGRLPTGYKAAPAWVFRKSLPFSFDSILGLPTRNVEEPD